MVIDMYLEIVKKYENERPYGKIELPADANKIKEVEKYFRSPLPTDLEKLLTELNGDGYLLFSAEKIEEENQMLTDVWSDTFLDISKFLFFAENGCGDYYGYRKNENGNYGDEIYLWEHETQESATIAASLLEFIEQYYEGKI